MATWREKLLELMADNGDDWSNVEQIAIEGGDASLDIEFDDGYGGEEGKPFTVWTKTLVYFPVGYDGSESVGSVSRNPDGQPTPHHGG